MLLILQNMIEEHQSCLMHHSTLHKTPTVQRYSLLNFRFRLRLTCSASSRFVSAWRVISRGAASASARVNAQASEMR